MESTDKSKIFEGIELPEGHLTLEDEKLLKKYCINKNLVVDIGTYKGRSAIIAATFAKKVITIDYYLNDKIHTFEENKKYMAKYKNIEVLKGISWENVNLFEDNSIDVLIQDGDHSIAGIAKDIKNFYPKLKENCIIMIHDYKYQDGHVSTCMDVRGGVKKMLEAGLLQQVEIAGWYWIGKKI